MTSKKGMVSFDSISPIVMSIVVAGLLMGAGVIALVAFAQPGITTNYVYFTNSSDYGRLDYLAFWRFTTQSGTNTSDLKGNYNSTFVNATWTQSGKATGAFVFNGINNTINISFVSNITGLTQNVTLNYWINLISIGNDHHITKGTAADADNGGVRTSGGKYLVSYNGANALNWTYGTDWTANSWAMFTVVGTTSECILYFNGAKKANATVSCNQVLNKGSNMFIGWSPYQLHQAVNAFNGTIDEVRVYNRSLTAAEISFIYNTTATNYSNTYLNYTYESYDARYTATNNVITGVTNISSQLGTVGTMIGIGLILLVIVGAFVFLQGGGNKL